MSGPQRGITEPQPTAIEERRRLRKAKQRRFVIWVSGASIVILVAAIGTVGTAIVSSFASADEPARTPLTSEPAALIEFPDDVPAAANGAEPCTTVTVMSSFENAEMVGNLAAGYNAQPRDIDGHCVVVSAVRDKSGVAAEAAAAGFPNVAPEARPIVWLPDSYTWLALARADGATAVPEAGTSVGSSNIVLAMPAPLVESIGWDAKPPTWGDVFDSAADAELWSDLGHPEWGAFKLGKTSPVVATSGEAAMFASFGTASGDLAGLTVQAVEDPAVQDTVREHELATSHYMATPEHFLWHARQADDKGSVADFLSAVIVDEKSVWDYNRGITSRDGVTRVEGAPPEEKLVPIYPTDGFYGADNPAVVLTGDWVDENEADAAADFIRYAGTAQGQEIVRTSGYRDLNGALDSGVADVANLPAEPAGRPAASRAGCRRRRQHRVPRCAQARPGALPHGCLGLDGRADLGDRHQADRGQVRHREGARPLHGRRQRRARRVRAEPGRRHGAGQRLADGRDRHEPRRAPRGARRPAVDGRHPAVPGRRHLRDAAGRVLVVRPHHRDRAAQRRQERHAQRSDDRGRADARDLQAMHHDTPVLIFTLAYGADADVATLQSISSATGAHYYDATDPTKLSAVLGDLVTSF